MHFTNNLVKNNHVAFNLSWDAWVDTLKIKWHWKLPYAVEYKTQQAKPKSYTYKGENFCIMEESEIKKGQPPPVFKRILILDQTVY